MSRDSPPDIPPELRRAFGQASTGEPASDDGPDLDELWSLLEAGKPSEADLPDASKTWTGVRRHLDADRTTEEASASSSARRRRTSRTRSRHRSRWQWGAAVAIVALVALGAWLWTRPIVATAPPGTSVTKRLPDGSTAELGGGTRLSYSRTFSTIDVLEDNRRVVRLRGQAYFDVQSTDRPFEVHTESAHIEVVGTAFAVRTDATTGRTYVALAEGTVRVHGRSTPNDRDPVTLQPGQAVEMSATGAISPPADTSLQRILAWRRGGFAVTAQPLPEIAQALEQQFGTSVRISGAIPDAVRSSPLTLYYSQDVEIETILHDISLARNLSYRPITNGYVLAPANESRPSSGPSKR